MKLKEATKLRFSKIIQRKKLKWGVAGCGKFSETAIMPAIEALQRSQLVSVYSHDLKRAKSLATKFSASGAFDDYSEFLRQDFDIVYIGSANADHYQQVIEAARAGKHILCEKPLAMNSIQAREMVEECEKNNVVLSINYVHRFHPLSVKAKELIERGYIGKIVHITASFDIDYVPDENFRFRKEKSGGGALRDLGTHMIDVLRFFGGEVDSSSGYIDNIVYKSEVDDFATGMVKFEKGGYGNFSCSFSVKAGFNRIEIIGHKGSISIENLVGGRDKSVKLTINLAGEGKKSFRRRGNKINFRLKALQNDMLKGLRPEVSGSDGYKNMLIMESIENVSL